MLAGWRGREALSCDGGGLDENEWTSCCDNAMEIEDVSGGPRHASVLGRSPRGRGLSCKLVLLNI